MRIRVVFTGRSYQTAGHLPDEITLPAGAGLDDALRHLNEQLPEGGRLPLSCLVAVSGEHLGTLADHAPRQLSDGDEVVFIAPVAGG